MSASNRKELNASDLFNVAVSHCEKKQWDDAIDCFHRVIDGCEAAEGEAEAAADVKKMKQLLRIKIVCTKNISHLHEHKRDWVNAATSFFHAGEYNKLYNDMPAAINYYLSAIKMFEKLDSITPEIKLQIGHCSHAVVLLVEASENKDFKQLASSLYKTYLCGPGISNVNVGRLALAKAFQSAGDQDVIAEDYDSAMKSYAMAIEFYEAKDEMDLADNCQKLFRIAKELKEMGASFCESSISTSVKIKEPCAAIAPLSYTARHSLSFQQTPLASTQQADKADLVTTTAPKIN
ncbi:MAG: hypothetical protein P4M14_13490 [Gammaproteobacteria bacterium]|nr:hypothetical protein [Gammaproteobacteria bacterium]